MASPTGLVMAMLILTAFSAIGAIGGHRSEAGSTCEPVKISLCSSVGYNATRMPNLAGDELQEDANNNVVTFAPLIRFGCSPELQFFLCAVYAPMCVSGLAESPQSEAQASIGPCRPLCQRVERSCAPILGQFGFEWPQVLDCSRFPETNGHGHMCMDGGYGGEDKTGSGGSRGDPRSVSLPPSLYNTLRSNPLFMQRVREQLQKSGGAGMVGYKEYVQLLDGGPLPTDLLAPVGPCGSTAYVYVASLSDDRDPMLACRPRCPSASVIASEEARTALDVTLAACASVAAFVSTLTLCRHALFGPPPPSGARRNGLAYPERSLLFLTFSLAGLNAGFLFRAVFSREDILCERTEDGGDAFFTVRGDRIPICFLTFLLTYFFSVATLSWALVGAAAWCLEAAREWDGRRLQSTASNVFHVLGWGVPVSMTVYAMTSGAAIEADESLGVCAAGGQTADALLGLVLAPEATGLSAILVLVVAASFSQVAKSKKATTSAVDFKSRLVFSSVFLVLKSILFCCICVRYFRRPTLAADVFSDTVDPFTVAAFVRAVAELALALWTAGFAHIASVAGSPTSSSRHWCCFARQKQRPQQEQEMQYVDVGYVVQNQQVRITLHAMITMARIYSFHTLYNRIPIRRLALAPGQRCPTARWSFSR